MNQGPSQSICNAHGAHGARGTHQAIKQGNRTHAREVALRSNARMHACTSRSNASPPLPKQWARVVHLLGCREALCLQTCRPASHPTSRTTSQQRVKRGTRLKLWCWPCHSATGVGIIQNALGGRNQNCPVSQTVAWLPSPWSIMAHGWCADRAREGAPACAHAESTYP